MSFMASYAALWGLIVFLSLVALGLLREVTTIKRAVSQAGVRGDSPLPIGSRAPRFSAIDVRSGRQETSSALEGHTTAILFLNSGCSICHRLAHELNLFMEANPISVLAVCNGQKHGCEEFLKPLSPQIPLLLDLQSELSELYGVSSYPTAVIVDTDREIRGYGYPWDAKSLTNFVTNGLRETGIEFNLQLDTSVAPGGVTRR